MNTYLIEHKIRTLAKLWKPCTHDGYEFRQWDFTGPDGPIGDAWITRKTIDASTVVDAITGFRVELFRLLDRIAFISQCFTSAEFESFLICKENNNPERVFFLNRSEEAAGVPLHFDDSEMAGLRKLDTFHEKGDVFRYIREAGNATTHYTRLVMLISALEAIAGEKAGRKSHKETNKEYIRTEILKDDELYKNIFDYGEGIRNRLLHGTKVDFDAEKHRDISYVDRIYDAIVTYFNEKCGTNISTDVVNPQRIPYGNYQVQKVWLKPEQKGYVFELKTVLKQFTEQFKSDGKTSVPDHFEIVQMPPNY